MAQQQRKFNFPLRLQHQGARHGAAGVQATPGALAQARGHHQPALAVVEFAAVAGPFVTAARAASHRAEGHPRCGATETAGCVQLRAQHRHRVARQAFTGRQVQARGGHAQAVCAGLAQHPFRQRHHAPGGFRRAQRPQPQLHLFDGPLCVHTPLQRHLQPGHMLAHAGEADAVFDTARAGALQRAAQRPDAATGHIVQQQPLTGRVGHRVIGPARDLVQAAVAGPGVASGHFRHMAAKFSVSQHVDPRPRRVLRRADRKVVAAVVRGEGTLGRRGGQTGLCHGPGLHHGPGADAVAGVLVALLAVKPALHLFGQRAAIGLQAHTRQGLQGVALVGAQVGAAQQPQDRAVCSRCVRCVRPVRRVACAGIGIHRRLPLQQQLQVVLHRREVRRRLTVDHHQIHTLPRSRPGDQRAHHQVDKRQAGFVVDIDAQDRPVATDAVAPQQALVATLGGQQFTGQFTRRHRRQQRLQVQHGDPAVGIQPGVVQQDRRHRVRHARRPFDVVRLAVLVHQRVEFVLRRRSRRHKGQLRGCAGRQPHMCSDDGHRVQAGVQQAARQCG